MDKKPVVPQFVADWYEEYKGYFEYNLHNLCVDFHERKLQENLHEWFNYLDNKPIETLVMMHKFGYVIEEGVVEDENKPTVPQFVAIWYEDNQDDFEFNLYRLCVDYYNCDLDMEMMIWFRDKCNNPIQTLTAMHQLGYVVDKEEIKKDH